MYTYYWYLICKQDSQFSELKEKWVLVCPDFPDIYIADVELDTKTYRDTKYRAKARDLIDKKLHAMYANGDTIPGGQSRMPDYFSFSVSLPDREPSAPSH